MNANAYVNSNRVQFVKIKKQLVNNLLLCLQKDISFIFNVIISKFVAKQ